MRSILMETEDLVLCFTEEEDLDQVLEIEQDKDNKYYIYQWSKEQHRSKIIDGNWFHLVIINRETDSIIGYVLLEGVTSEHKAIELTRITIKEKGRGYGKKAVRLIKKLCFENLKCHRLWLDVFEDNTKAIHLYEKEDFVYEGTLRECKKYKDTFYSMRIMSMLEHEYFTKK